MTDTSIQMQTQLLILNATYYITSIEICVWLVGGQVESLSWLEVDKVQEEDTEASNVSWKLRV